ncbi:MAG: Ig-like domain-containing protein [Bacilli bacterium]|jgi:uncharacterized repeat protein (TIGR02543 family)|nr:Ig-like domain-containing protein [Bacilli bacterium]
MKLNRGKILLFMLVIGLFTSISFKTLLLNAEVTYGEKESGVLVDPNVVIRGNSDTDATNAQAILDNVSWDDAASFIVVYPNQAAADVDILVSGQVTSVTFEGTTVSATVVIGNDFNSAPLNTLLQNDMTVFLKPGLYNNLSKNTGGGWQLQKNDLSIIGLESDTVTITAAKRGGLNESIGTGPAQNLYIKNIIFDGSNTRMASNTASSGLHFIKIMQGSNNIVFDNVTVQNVKSSGLLDFNNTISINVIGGDTVLFNDVKLINLSSAAGYGVVQTNNAATNVYFNNLSLDTVTSGNSSSGGSNYPFIKIENGSTGDQSTVKVFFTGTLSFSNMADQYKTIWIENYRYDTVAFPEEVYRYAQLRNQNGTWTTNYIALKALMPDTSNQYAIFDLEDNSFVVKKGDAISESNQVQTIIDTISFIRYIKGDSADEYYNVKYEVGSELENIDLPEIKPSTATFQTRYAGYFENIHLNIIPVEDEANTLDNKEVFDYVIGTSSINLPAVNETDSRYHLYNIDFDNVASLSLQEVIAGIDGSAVLNDPYYALYGTSNNLTYNEYLALQSKEVLYSNISTFESCIFTSLVSKIELVNNGSVPTQYLMGDIINLSVNLVNSNDNSYSYNDLNSLSLNKDTANDKPLSIKWYSTDPSVATVDQNGKVTILKEGNTTIVAKAIDTYNEGEIEKPWAIYEITAKSVSIHYDLNASDADRGSGVASEKLGVNNKLSSSTNYYNNPTRANYKFTGWYLDKECTKLADDYLMTRSDITVYAGWEKVEASDIDPKDNDNNEIITPDKVCPKDYVLKNKTCVPNSGQNPELLILSLTLAIFGSIVYAKLRNEN